MKTKKSRSITIILLLLPVCVVLLGAGCEKEEVSQTVLNGKWILLGFGDNSTGEFISEPESEPKSSYVVFDDGEMVAYSVTNRTFDMKYIVNEGKKLSIIPGIMTLVGGDTEWGHKFLITIIDIYEFDINDELILYYEDQKFMKFKKVIK